MQEVVPLRIERKQDPLLICSTRCLHLLGIRINDKVSEERKKRFKECMDKCLDEMLNEEILMAYAQFA